MPFTHFIYLFHMAIFFMASGFCFKSSNSDSKKNVLQFIGRRLKGLWFPYVLWMTVFSLLHNTFIDIGIYTNDLWLTQRINNEILHITQPWSVVDTGINIVKAFFLHGHTQLGSALWFIATLFEIEVLYCLIDYVIKKVTANKTTRFTVQALASIVMLAIGYNCALSNSIWGVNRVLSFYCLFNLGAVIREIYIIEKTNKFHYWKIVGSLLLLIICNRIGSIALDENQYENPIFLLIVSICGWVFLYETALEIKKIKSLSDIIVCCGQNSMAIVVFHFLCFKIVNLIGVIVCKQPKGLIAAFPVLYNNGVWWIAYMSIGVIIPVLLSILWKRIKRKLEERCAMAG